ncbi:MAG TPA: hypothetical protein VMZ11_00305 [Mycobacteriales bacterium]|nr:hypothetical protein [Mycobacteriales bacterium]
MTSRTTPPTPDLDAELDTEPQWDETGEHWWDGRRWMPGEEARAKAATVVAYGGTVPAYLPQPDRARGQRSAFLKRQLILASVLLVLVGTVLVAALLARDTPPTEGPVGQALRSAATAEQVHLTRTKEYTGSPVELAKAGYQAKPGVTLSVLRADRRSYCLKGSRGDVVLYVSSDAARTTPSQVTFTPCV